MPMSEKSSSETNQLADLLKRAGSKSATTRIRPQSANYSSNPNPTAPYSAPPQRRATIGPRPLSRIGSQLSLPIATDDTVSTIPPDLDPSSRWQHFLDSVELEKKDPINYVQGFPNSQHPLLSYYAQLKSESINSSEPPLHQWYTAERTKTTSILLCLCLNLGIDPPDTVRPFPCARQHCWIDPMAESHPSKCLERIGQQLQVQYECWQPRAKYRVALDPTIEDMRKCCTAMRKGNLANSASVSTSNPTLSAAPPSSTTSSVTERVLFHYNGQGVPRPTPAGELWLFNKQYTQYVPCSLYDVQTWCGNGPLLMVYDCSNAGRLVEAFERFTLQRNGNNGAQNYHIQLGACQSQETLPMHPDLPADLFTACLTTPMEVALRYFVSRHASHTLVDLTPSEAVHLPGRLNDRRTLLGELHWIFTAITDTIAWSLLPRSLFKRLFRQDLLVAALMRHYLLACRVMRTYACHPISVPTLPGGHEQHALWQSWDLAVEQILLQWQRQEKQLPLTVQSKFFEEQLTAFEVWLQGQTRGGFSLLQRKKQSKTGLKSIEAIQSHPPEQLPMVLQVLLSQQHRLRALSLLAQFLHLGPLAVYHALQVGIFPYVLKLLQSPLVELRPMLILLWQRILTNLCVSKCKNTKSKGSNSPIQQVKGCQRYFIQSATQASQGWERWISLYILILLNKDNENDVEDSATINELRELIPLIESVLLNEKNMDLERLLCSLLLNSFRLEEKEESREESAQNKSEVHILSLISHLLNDSFYLIRACGVWILSNKLNESVTILSLLLPFSRDASCIVRREWLIAMSHLNKNLIREGLMMAVSTASGNVSFAHPLLLQAIGKCLLCLTIDPVVSVSLLAQFIVDESLSDFLPVEENIDLVQESIFPLKSFLLDFCLEWIEEKWTDLDQENSTFGQNKNDDSKMSNSYPVSNEIESIVRIRSHNDWQRRIIFESTSQISSSFTLHPTLPIVALFSPLQIHVFDWNQSSRQDFQFSSLSESIQGQWLNETNLCLLDSLGRVKIYSISTSEKEISFLNGFQALSSLSSRTPLMQHFLHKFYLSIGDALNGWDLQTLQPILNIPNLPLSAMTCISSNVLGLGYSDGSISLLDTRVGHGTVHNSSYSFVPWQDEHDSAVIKVTFKRNELISVSAQGDVKQWDPRYLKGSIQTLYLNDTLTCFDASSRTSHVACATIKHGIRLVDYSSSVKHSQPRLKHSTHTWRDLAFHGKYDVLVGLATDGIVSLWQ